MELSQLNAFVITSELKNMTKASERLNLSLSALSTQIKSLECDLNVSLFSRNARGVELTPDGAALIEYARNVTDTVNAMKRQAMMMQKEMKGTITFGLNTDPVFLKVPKLNSALIHRIPDVTIRFAISESGKTAYMLKSRELDMGFMYGKPYDDEIHYIEMQQVNICMVISKGMIQSTENVPWAQITALPWVSGSTDCPFRMELDRRIEEYTMPKRMVIAADETVMMELVKTGMGVCVMREDNARLLQKQGYVDVFEDKTISMTICLAVLKNRMEEPLLKAGLEVARSVFENE